MARNRLRELWCSWSLAVDECIRFYVKISPRFGALTKSVRYLARSACPQISSVSMALDGIESVTVSPSIERTLVVVHRKRGPLPAVAERFRQSLLS